MNRDNLMMLADYTQRHAAYMELINHFKTPEDDSFSMAYMRMCRAAAKGAEQCMKHHECTVMESGNIMGLYNYHTREYDPYFGVWKLDTTR